MTNDPKPFLLRDGLGSSGSNAPLDGWRWNMKKPR